MNSYIIKVLWNGKDIVFRDLKASEKHSLLDLHNAIVTAFDLKGDQMAGFTQIDESLGIEADYQLEAFDENSSLMKDVRLKEVLQEEGSYLDYTYDILNEVSFGVEVMEVSEEEVKTIELSKSHGKLPENLFDMVDPENAEEMLIQAMLDEVDVDEDSEDPFESGDFESLDDYEDLY